MIRVPTYTLRYCCDTVFARSWAKVMKAVRSKYDRKYPTYWFDAEERVIPPEARGDLRVTCQFCGSTQNELEMVVSVHLGAEQMALPMRQRAA